MQEKDSARAGSIVRRRRREARLTESADGTQTADRQVPCRREVIEEDQVRNISSDVRAF